MRRSIITLMLLTFALSAHANSDPKGSCEIKLTHEVSLTRSQANDIKNAALEAVRAQTNIVMKYKPYSAEIVNAFRVEPLMHELAPYTLYVVKVAFSVSPSIIYQVNEGIVAIAYDGKTAYPVKSFNEFVGF